MVGSEIMTSLLLGGLLGVVGQGARAVVGLKKLADENAAKAPNETDAFIASRLLVSLFIGFIAGVIAAISLGMEKLTGASAAVDVNILLGIAAAGYAGSDIVEAFVARTPGMGGTEPKKADGGGKPDPSPDPTGTAQPGGATVGAAVSALVTSSNAMGDATSSLLKAQAASLEAQATSFKSMIAGFGSLFSGPTTAPATAHETAPATFGDGFDLITPELVQNLFVPATPLANIRLHLPNVLAGLRSRNLVDKKMLLMALATIRAESEGFAPINEFISKFNTAKSPFDKYDAGTAIGNRLGNTQPGDGQRFRGRGFIQLTGRYNYTEIGGQVGVDLVSTPERANDFATAATILAQFLANKEADIRAALAANDLSTARRLVNGGTHGLDRFKDAFAKGDELIPDFDVG